MRPSYPSSCSFSENGTLPFCFCYNRYNCTASESIRLDFSSVPGINSADPSLDDIRHAMVHFLGERCRAPVNYAITQSLLDCNDQWAALDAQLHFPDGYTYPAFEGVCNNSCLQTIFTSVAVLNTTDCMYVAGYPVIKAIDVQDTEFIMKLLCARGNRNLCGVAQFKFLDFGDFGSISAAGCQTIVDSGQCLGTLAAHIGTDLNPGWSPNAIVSSLDGNCTALNVTGIAQAAQGAEPEAVLRQPIPSFSSPTSTTTTTTTSTTTTTTSQAATPNTVPYVHVSACFHLFSRP